MDAWFGSAAGFALAMTASPGPNNAMVAASGANFGLRRTVPHIIGVALGFPVMLVLVALGAAELLRESPGLQAGLRWAGAAWMLWLAWKLAMLAPGGVPGRAGARPMSLVQAALFQWINPKAWVISAGAVATYTGSGAGVLRDALVLAAMFGVIAVVCLVLWALLGQGTARLLRSPGALRWFNRAMAALLVVSLLPLLA